MSFLFGLAIGVAVGWMIPVPQWFADFVAKVKDKIKSENP